MKTKILLSILFVFSVSVFAQKKDIPQTTLTHTEPKQGSITIYGPYLPDVNSLQTHPCPEWFRDAKFGMFIDWGLYSVAGWAPKKEKGAMYPDWFMADMVYRDEYKKYVTEKYGKDFKPDDFIPMFTAENYQPEKLMRIAADAGMKYVIPFCKHHDGFCLWSSSYTGRDAMDMGPHRDFIRPLVDECNRLGLKFGFYFSVEEHCTPILVNGEKKIRRWTDNRYGDIIDGNPYHPWDPARIKYNMSGKYLIDGDFFTDYMVPQAKEFIDMFDPDILWFDGEWMMTPEELHTPEIISYFYNKAEGRKEVANNDRNGQSRFKFGDFFCSEYHQITDEMKLAHPWEENRGISQSFGYNWQDTEENVLSIDDFIDLFTRTVSENGNLLLIVNLDGKGALPEVQERRLHEIGKWLKINGEAIYSSRPYLVTNQDNGKIRFTQSKDGKTVYAICTDFPKDKLKLKPFYLGKKSKISMLGAEHIELQWEQVKTGWENRDLEITIPESLYEQRKNEYAWVFKISLL
jgi:alpha-L-fucosidase